MSARAIRRAHRRELERRERRLSSKATLVAGAGATVGATMLFAPAAEAATLTVTNLNDAGAGSLRQALADAEGTAEADTIVFQSGLSGTIELVTDLNVRNYSVDIQGPGASVITIDGPATTQIFDLYGFAAGQAVGISGLTLTNGNGYIGGAVYIGGFNGDAADTTFDSVVINNNSAGGAGGAIGDYNDPTDLTILNSTISGNSADQQGGGVYKSSPGTLTITDSTISNNDALYEGGGVYTDESALTISGSTISGNDADREGGGIYVDDTPGTASTEVTIQDSTFSANTSPSEGGGVYLDSIDGAAVVERNTFSGNDGADGGGIYFDSDNAGPLTIANSTFTGNTAYYDGGAVGIDDTDFATTIENVTMSGNSVEDEGGALYLDGKETSDGDPAVIRNSTIVGNDADSADEGGGGIFREDFASGGVDRGRDVELSSTIVANNTAPVNPDLSDAEEINDGSEFELGFSLVEDLGNAATSENPAGSNIIGTDPQLGPLTDNGGPTQTHLPALSSPVMDAGIANGLGQDQRGNARTFDATNLANPAGGDGTDIGAVEQAASGVCKGLAATVLFAPGAPITGSEGNDVIVGTAGNDQISALGGVDTVCAGDGADKTNTGAGKDFALGEAGKDKLSGKGGKDKLKGGAGNDKEKGGPGKDKLSGQAGKDTLKGQGGKDTLKGGPGKDKLRGGPGKDKLKGGGGKDSEVQ